MQVKGKLFQLRFLEEVICDRSVAKRSQTTGHMIITMPKLYPEEPLPTTVDHQPASSDKSPHNRLEVTGQDQSLDFSQIVLQDSPPPLEQVDSDWINAN